MRSISMVVAAFCALLAGCGKQPAPPRAAVKPVAAKDESSLFPENNRVATEPLKDHLMNKPFLPGGTVADYRDSSGAYREFVVHAADGESAAFLLEDYRKALQSAREVQKSGGYFGLDNGQPVYLFVKGSYLAGVIGLPEDRAGAEAKLLASKLG